MLEPIKIPRFRNTTTKSCVPIPMYRTYITDEYYLLDKFPMYSIHIDDAAFSGGATAFYRKLGMAKLFQIEMDIIVEELDRINLPRTNIGLSGITINRVDQICMLKIDYELLYLPVYYD